MPGLREGTGEASEPHPESGGRIGGFSSPILFWVPPPAEDVPAGQGGLWDPRASPAVLCGCKSRTRTRTRSKAAGSLLAKSKYRRSGHPLSNKCKILSAGTGEALR